METGVHYDRAHTFFPGPQCRLATELHPQDYEKWGIDNNPDDNTLSAARAWCEQELAKGP